MNFFRQSLKNLIELLSFSRICDSTSKIRSWAREYYNLRLYLQMSIEPRYNIQDDTPEDNTAATGNLVEPDSQEDETTAATEPVEMSLEVFMETTQYCALSIKKCKEPIY